VLATALLRSSVAPELDGAGAVTEHASMLPRRGGRWIMVDGHELLWWVRRSGARGCPDCDECWVTVAHLSRRGMIVRVHVRDAWGPDVEIWPRQIAALARKALARGWVPGEGTGQFAGVDELPPVVVDPT